MKIGECSPLAFAKVAGEPSRLDNPWKDHYKQNVSKMGWYQNIKINVLKGLYQNPYNQNPYNHNPYNQNP